MESFLDHLSAGNRIAMAVALAVGAHFIVIGVRISIKHVLSWKLLQRWTKFRTLVGLISSLLIFILYFIALGLALREFGVSLTAYLASASVLGLAIGFGSQGIVQDVVTGLTLIFSDLLQVGDLVEISSQTGVVQSVGMRFTVVLNPLGAQVYVPNRTLSNVLLYPRGYVRCFSDITLTSQPDSEEDQRTLEIISTITNSFAQQYPGILRGKSEIDQPITTLAGRRYIRVKHRIWPGRAAPIENAYKNELIYNLQLTDINYADWMVSINSEISEKPRSVQPFRKQLP